jgi:hypothetical protein
MKSPATTNSARMPGYKVLALAVFFSLAWHLFCLSAIRIIPAKAEPSQAKYSKVSFLGPILSRVSIGVRAQPVKRSFLEGRYAANAGKALSAAPSSEPSRNARDVEAAPAADVDKKMPRLVDDAVSGLKAEPQSPAS